MPTKSTKKKDTALADLNGNRETESTHDIRGRLHEKLDIELTMVKAHLARIDARLAKLETQ